MTQRALGKLIGVLSGATGVVLVPVFFFANPSGRQITADEAGLWVYILPGFGVVGVLAAIAALCGARRTLLVLFVVSFFPFGLYLFAFTSIVSLFGAAQLGYVAAAVMLKPPS